MAKIISMILYIIVSEILAASYIRSSGFMESTSNADFIGLVEIVDTLEYGRKCLVLDVIRGDFYVKKDDVITIWCDNPLNINRGLLPLEGQILVAAQRHHYTVIMVRNQFKIIEEMGTYHTIDGPYTSYLEYRDGNVYGEITHSTGRISDYQGDQYYIPFCTEQVDYQHLKCYYLDKLYIDDFKVKWPKLKIIDVRK